MMEKFVVEQKTFLSLLSSMQPICSKRTTVDATSSLLLQVGPSKELVIKSTDLEISLQASYILHENTFNSNASFLVNGKRLFDIVKELEDIVTFVFNGNQLSLTSGNVHLALNIADAQEFPPFPERIENLMNLNAQFLLQLLDKIAFLIPQSNANPALNGLLLEINSENLTMTTTDGHCLAQVKTNKYNLGQTRQWLMPRRAVIELKKIIESSSSEKELFLGTCGNQLVFSGESFNFFTKVLSNAFPEYKPILNKQGFVPACVDRNHLIKTLRRSTCLLSGKFIATSLLFTQNSVDVSMNNKEVGKLDESLPMQEFTGESLDMKFYAPYLLNGLHSFTEDSLRFYLNNATRPIIFESNGSDDCQFLYLVMPVSPTVA